MCPCLRVVRSHGRALRSRHLQPLRPSRRDRRSCPRGDGARQRGQAFETLVAAGSRCLFVVGHEPLLSEMVARAVGYGAADIVLRKGGVVEMDVICTKPLRAELLGLIRPIHLR